MASIKGTKTEQNLLKAFAGESQARNRYTMYAKKARDEGYHQIAAIFLETADNELEHAKQFFKFFEGGEIEITAGYPTDIGTTKENLKFAAAGENIERTKLYPSFGEIAEKEGFSEIALKFKAITKIETEHEKRYLAFLNQVTKGTVFKKDKKVRWKCRECGYIWEGETPPKVCPFCGHSHEYYEVAVDYV